MKNDKKFNVKRRAALKKSIQGAVATGAVSAAYSWKKPIIESMVLPAHAVTTSKTLSVSNLTIIEQTSGSDATNVALSANNLVSGTNIGTTLYDGSADYGLMNATGKITPPPPAGTVVNVSAITAIGVDKPSGGAVNSNCFFFIEPPTCLITVPVDSTNGDFALAVPEVNGLDDNNEENNVTVTFSCMDAPPFIVDFTIAIGSS